jgi:periplasmic copper chaperone A
MYPSDDSHMNMNIQSLKRLCGICVALGVGLGAGLSAQAQATVDRAWARATVPNQSSTGAFVRLTVLNWTCN